MRTTSSIQFYCRRSKVGKRTNGLAPVEVSIIICGQRTYCTLPLKVAPDEFNKKRRPPYITEALEAWRRKINDYQTQMLRLGIRLTPASLKEAIQNDGFRHYQVKDMFNDYKAILKRRIGVDLCESVYNKYLLTEKKICQFISPDEEIEKITPQLVQMIAAQWRSEYNLSTAANYLVRFKTYVKYARSLGYLPIDPFINTKVVKPQNRPIFALDKEEIEGLLHREYDSRLQRILDMFLAMIATGMSYSDMQEYRRSQHLKKEGDFYYVAKRRKKNKKWFYALVLPFGVPYLLRYEQFPRISNQKMNKALKLIGDKYTTHLGRRSYASYLAQCGSRLDINTIAAALGDDPATAMRYYTRILPEDMVKRQIKLVMGQ